MGVTPNVALREGNGPGRSQEALHGRGREGRGGDCRRRSRHGGTPGSTNGDLTRGEMANARAGGREDGAL